MKHMVRGVRMVTKPLTTDANGNCVATIEEVTGKLLAWQFILGTLASGAVDVTITESNYGLTLYSGNNANANVTKRPRFQLQDSAGSNISFYEPLALADAVITVTLAQGGNAKTGQIRLWVEN